MPTQRAFDALVSAVSVGIVVEGVSIIYSMLFTTTTELSDRSIQFTVYVVSTDLILLICNYYILFVVI